MAAVWDGADPCLAQDATSVLRDDSLTGTITGGRGGYRFDVHICVVAGAYRAVP